MRFIKDESLNLTKFLAYKEVKYKYITLKVNFVILFGIFEQRLPLDLLKKVYHAKSIF